jgi:hypothetical protein
LTKSALLAKISLVRLSGISGISSLISHNGFVGFIGLGLIGVIGHSLVSLGGLICHIISPIGLKGLSLIISGMNPNVTFAPLGAGSGQQNSGNSASLQPTTQSNLLTNAGLVGKLGAKKVEQYSLAILRVPTSGTGMMAGAPLTINSISLVNVDCKRLGLELGYRYMDIVYFMLLFAPNGLHL